MSTIADRIIEVVNHQTGGNMSEFARQIGVSPTYISKFKTSPERIPSGRTVGDICRIYGVREHWLRTGEGDMMEPLERDQEIARILGRILSADSPSVKRRFINVLCKASEEELEAIERFAVRLADEYKKETGGE